jgi:hypothetical protein
MKPPCNQLHLRFCLRSALPWLWLAALLLPGCFPRTTGGGAPGAAVPGQPPSKPVGPPFVDPKFVDVTQAAGIDFRHQSCRTPEKHLIEMMGSGCAFIDTEGRGQQDILLLNDRAIPGGKVEGRPTLKLYRNNGNGTFTDVTHRAGLDDVEMYAMGVAVGDYDNDGREDFYVSCVLGPGRLFHNEGGGRFKDVTAQAGVANMGKWGTSCAWVDYDRDGKLDLFICNYVKYRSLADEIACHTGDGKERSYCLPAVYDRSVCTLYRNLGGGRFKDVTQETGLGAAQGKSLGVAIWDNDGSGYPDIYVANDTTPEFLFRNDHHGGFQEVGQSAGIALNDEGGPHSGMGIDLADADNNGKPDLIFTNYYAQQTSFYREAAPGLFREDRLSTGIGSATASYLGFGILFFDYDNDGWQDIIEVNGHVQDTVERHEMGTRFAEPTLLFRNQRDGTYAEVGQKSGAPFDRAILGRGCAWGDFDNDGRLDLLITSNNGPAMLWHNETSTHNHWLKLKLAGVKSNRDAIGALVIATAGGLTQRRMVRSGSSYLSQSDLRPNFGLGSQLAADIEIRWPSGTVDRLHSVPADHIWTVQEGSGAYR